MTSGEDWLLRPVLRGLCSYTDLKSGLLDLLDLVKMNEALEVESHNQELLKRG